MKLKLILAYDGSKFQGSSTQPHQNSVQDALSAALKRLGIDEKPLFASRTDKGVHALANVASVECEHFSDLNALKSHLNRHAHPHIHIKKITQTTQDFEVRFHAKARSYRYLLNHGEFSPFLAPYFYFYPRIDLVRANAILRHFEGSHNFKNFSKQFEKNATRTIFKAHAFSHKNLTAFCFKADGFVRGQIRLMVSALLKVLSGKMREDDLLRQIYAFENNENLSENSCENLSKNSLNLDENFTLNSTNFSRTLAPANGLYLTRIFY